MSSRTRIVLASSMALFACDMPVRPTEVGGAGLRVVTAPGSVSAFDSVRIHLRDKATRDTAVKPPAQVLMDGLPAGSYTVSIEGFVDSEVVNYGETTAVVEAGKNKTVSVNLGSFVTSLNPLPDTVLDTIFTVKFAPVSHAASYEVETATNTIFTQNHQSKTSTQTTVQDTVHAFDTYYVRVRAKDGFPGGRGSPTAIDSIVLPRPASICLLPGQITFNAERGQGKLVQSFAVTNCGERPLTGLSVTKVFKPGQDTGWLKPTLSDSNAAATLTIEATPTSLPESTYMATVSVLSPVADNSPRIIGVTLNIESRADHLLFTSQPTSTVAGKTIVPIQVTVQDALDGTVTTSADSVTVSITPGTGTSGASLSGSVRRAAVAGVATFNDLSIAKVGTGYTLQASAFVGLNTIQSKQPSSAFNITPDTATHLAFTVQPAGAQAGAVLTPPVQVTALDAHSNVATTFSGAVTVAIGSNPSIGNLLGTKSVTPSAGIATFSNLSIDSVGNGYTLTAAASGVTGDASSPFNIINSAISATTSRVTANPTTISVSPGNITSTITITAKDGSGNSVQGATVSLAATGTGNTVIQPGTVTNAQGIATGSLSSTDIGQKIVTATINGVVVTQTDTVNVISSGCTNCWTSRAPLLTPRTGHGIGVVNGRMFAVGGYNGTYLASVEEYDTTTNTWVPRSPMKTARRRLAVGVVNGKLYAVGGFNGSYLKTVEEYNPNTDQWTTVDSMPTPRHRLAVAVANGRLYAIGGQNTNGTLRTVEEFNPGTNTWIPVDSLVTGRYGLGADSAAGVVYALGGYNGSYPTAIEAFNLTTKKWSTVPAQAQPLTGRSGLGLGVVGGRLYAVGGYDGSFLAVVQEYNPATNTWATKQPLPSVRAALAAGVVNGKLYAVGGDIGGPALATVEVFVP